MHRAHYWFYVTICMATSILRPAFSPEQMVQLNLPKIPRKFYFYDLTKIHIMPRDGYHKLIDVWQERLNKASRQLFDQLSKELGLTPQAIYDHASNKHIVGRYHILKKSEFMTPIANCIVHEKDIDPEILLFLQSIVQKYTTKRDIHFCLTDKIPGITTTYGSDLEGYWIFCNASVYTKEHIAQYYESLQDQHGYFYVEQLDSGEMRWIEISSLLQIGLIEAASRVQHQTSLLGFILNNFSFKGRKASKQSVELYGRIQEIHTLLEATLQSHNPLEVAVFLMRMESNEPKDRKIWRKIVTDIAQIYDPTSIQKAKLFARAMKDAGIPGQQ